LGNPGNNEGAFTDPFRLHKDTKKPADPENWETMVTYHGHTTDTKYGQFPNAEDLYNFTHVWKQISYHVTYINTIPKKIFVWDNLKGTGYNINADDWEK
jgi:hypothetical protein